MRSPVCLGATGDAGATTKKIEKQKKKKKKKKKKRKKKKMKVWGVLVGEGNL